MDMFNKLCKLASNIEDFNWRLEQVRAGCIKPTFDQIFPLSKAAEVHSMISTDKVTGRHVLLQCAD